MNRIFNILWFDDNQDWYKMAERKIKKSIEEHNLIPLINNKVGGDYNETELCDNRYDLLLIDYKLMNNDTGDKIIEQVRKHNILTDTLLYSSDEDKMMEVIRGSNPLIDGIYYTKREILTFQDKVNKLIKKIVKRSENLVNLRGFVLDDSCDFEVRIKALLTIAWNKFAENDKVELEATVTKEIQDKINEPVKFKAELTKKTPPYFLNVIENEHFFSHSDRLSVLTKVINILSRSSVFPNEKYAKFKNSYEDEISCYRNALGHKTSKENCIKIKGKIIEIDEVFHRQMRTNLTKYDKLITYLENYITNL